MPDDEYVNAGEPFADVTESALQLCREKLEAVEKKIHDKFGNEKRDGTE
jgi:hypothetical protein